MFGDRCVRAVFACSARLNAGSGVFGVFACSAGGFTVVFGVFGRRVFLQWCSAMSCVRVFGACYEPQGFLFIHEL